MSQNWRRSLALLALSLGVAACAHTRPEPQVRTVEVRVEVPVPCLKPGNRPKRPARTPRPALSALPLPEAVRRLLVERDLSEAYELEAEAALDACAAVPAGA